MPERSDNAHQNFTKLKRTSLNLFIFLAWVKHIQTFSSVIYKRDPHMKLQSEDETDWNYEFITNITAKSAKEHHKYVYPF